jgi:hypothetical protein
MMKIRNPKSENLNKSEILKSKTIEFILFYDYDLEFVTK